MNTETQQQEKTDEQKFQDLFYTNSYPSERDSNKGLISFIKIISLAIPAFETYIAFELVKHVYEYVMKIHREPDFVMIMASIYLFGSVLKSVVCIYGYHFLHHITERTPENYDGLFKLLKIISAITGIVAFGIYQFLNFHETMYNKKFGALDDGVVRTIRATQKTLAFQFSCILIYFFMFKELRKRESTQEQIVDTLAASIGKDAVKTEQE